MINFKKGVLNFSKNTVFNLETLNNIIIKKNFFPADLDILEKVIVQYETLPGWQTDISKCRQFSDLPINAQNYIKIIEKYLEVPSKLL